jgi:hypothetical protein
VPLAASPLAAWRTFYEIVGSSAGALTGLQFVVVALSAQTRRLQRTDASLHAFGTPTIVHFGAVLVTAAIVAAPWASLSAAGIALLLCGAGGIGYTVVVIWRARRQRDYPPVLEDWIWHAAAPAVAYVVEVAAAVVLPARPAGALFWVGGAAVLLLATGIHNAWDAAAYIALAGARSAAERSTPAPPDPPA